MAIVLFCDACWNGLAPSFEVTGTNACGPFWTFGLALTVEQVGRISAHGARTVIFVANMAIVLFCDACWNGLAPSFEVTGTNACGPFWTFGLALAVEQVGCISAHGARTVIFVANMAIVLRCNAWNSLAPSFVVTGTNACGPFWTFGLALAVEQVGTIAAHGASPTIFAANVAIVLVASTLPCSAASFATRLVTTVPAVHNTIAMLSLRNALVFRSSKRWCCFAPQFSVSAAQITQSATVWTQISSRNAA
jgi:hypothetical protein